MALLEWLQETGHTFLSYSEAVDQVVSGPVDRPYVAFSFDDGLRSGLEAGRILESFGASACYFLNSIILGETNYDRIKSFCAERHFMPPVEFLSWSDVELLVRRGHEVGGHSRSHFDISRLTGEQISDEVRSDMELLSAKAGTLRHFSWPYGKTGTFTQVARDIVFKSGYQTCASAIRGTHTTGAMDSRFFIRRDHVIAAGPLRHISYFIARSARSSDETSNDWPSLAQGVDSVHGVP